MNFTERHYKILVVSADDRFIKEVASLLQGDRFRPDASHSASDARCKLLEKAYDLVVVNAPLRDDSGSRLCIDVCRDNGTIAAIFAACSGVLIPNPTAAGILVTSLIAVKIEPRSVLISERTPVTPMDETT